MTGPRRLLDASSNEALRSLLGAGLDDAPSPDALPKVAAALGVATVAVTASSLVASNVAAQAALTAKGAALGGSAPAATGALGFWGTNTVAALGKTLLVSMVSAGTLSAGAVAVYEYTEPSGANTARVERAPEVHAGVEPRAARVRPQQAPAPSVAAVAEPPVPEAAPTQPAPSRAQPEANAPEAQRESVTRAVRPLAVSATETASQRTGVLAREVRQIDSARQALESKNADGALAALDGYERSRVVGVLDREALLLKIEALTQKQELDQAKALARQYVERFPTDTHVPRLRALLGAASSNAQAFPDE